MSHATRVGWHHTGRLRSETQLGIITLHDRMHRWTVQCHDEFSVGTRCSGRAVLAARRAFPCPLAPRHRGPEIVPDGKCVMTLDRPPVARSCSLNDPSWVSVSENNDKVNCRNFNRGRGNAASLPVYSTGDGPSQPQSAVIPTLWLFNLV